MLHHRSTPFVLAFLLLTCPPLRAESPGGIGVLGDSYSDEYQFWPPDRSTARNWVEILAATRGLDFGSFSTQGRGEPRNQGFAYNWARSDATTDDMIRTGQHTGLASQVVEGKVRYVCVLVGGNDFINAMKAPAPLAALEAMLPRALDNYRVAVRTILDASPDVRLVLFTLPDIRHLPEFDGPIRAGRIPSDVADAFTRAMARFNAQVRSLAASDPRAALMDFDRAAQVATLLDPDRALVAGRWLDRKSPRNDLDHFFLADVRHPGTLGQGMMAQMFVGVLNAKFGAGIAPVGNAELVSFASSLPSRSDPRDAVAGIARLDGGAIRHVGLNGR